MEISTSSSYHTSIYSKRFESLSRWIVLIVLWAIILSIAVGKAGITNLIALSKERDVLLDTVKELTQENENMANLYQILSNSRQIQERYLKQNFGYVEQNEFVFQFQNSDFIRNNIDAKL